MTFTCRKYLWPIFGSFFAALIFRMPCTAAAPAQAMPIPLSATVIDPSDKISWQPEEWLDYLVDARRAGFDTFILAWSARNGRSLFPSQNNIPYHDRGTTDIAEIILAAADALHADVYVGLDATVKTEEIFYDEYDAQLERCINLMDELADTYGHHESLKGYLIPQEGSGLPGKEEAAFINGVAIHAHRTHPGRQVIARVSVPAYQRRGLAGNPALVALRKYTSLIDAPPADVAKVMDNDLFMNTWLKSWQKTLARDGGPDIILFSDGLGSMKSFPALTEYRLRKLRGIADESGIELWPVVEAYTLTRKPGDSDPSQARSIDNEQLVKNVLMGKKFADRIAVYGFNGRSDAMDIGRSGNSALPDPEIFRVTSGEDETEDILLKKALLIEEIIHSRHDREGQVITYRYMPYHIDHPRGAWQEDACWLTGILTAAESFRYAATGSADAEAYARRHWRALHKMANVTPVPGVVVRIFSRTFYGYNPDDANKKRWHKDPDREMYYIADISRDQLSGYFLGLAAYFDHAATPDEKEIIRTDVKNIMRPIIDNNMAAMEFNGVPTTYGDLNESPILALNYLLVAHHITGEQEYRDKYLELVNRRYLLRAAEGSATTFNHFFEHFDDSAYYHALLYETDPALLIRMAAGLDFLFTKASLNGNGHLLFDVATYRPWSDAAAMGLSELYGLNPEMLYVDEWAALPPVEEKGDYIPISRRRPFEYNWCWFPGIPFTQGGPETEFSGVDYLLAYWMGRYHGVIH